ncbi:hypothetical protein VPH35_107289 [Triticum aestivum]
MCMSILPRRISAGSRFSLWLVVNTMIRSPPQADHSPSMKLSTPDSVTLLSLSFSPSSVFFLLLRLPVRSMERSMSSITMMDLPFVRMKSLFSSVLLLTDVSSRL